jgi:putative ABC transport system permease protein
MGARNTVILALILQQALLLGALGLALASVLGQWIFPHFPRRVVVLEEDLGRLAAIVLAISFASSVLGIGKALRVQPNEVLS